MRILRRWRAFTGMMGFVSVIYAFPVSYLYLFQRDFVFKPGGELAAPADKGLADVEVRSYEMADGVRLTGWYARADAGKPSVLYFHGNAGNLSGRSDRFRTILASGFGLLAASYRGYPGSEGQPGERQMVADGLALYDWLAGQSDEIIVHGESLGTSIAVAVAASRDARALVLEAPYTAAVDLAAKQYPWIPVGLLMIDQFVSRERIGEVSEPLLIVHGSDDRIIPVSHGRRLHALAGEPKSLAVIDGAGHADLWPHGLWKHVLRMLAENPT
ncbi:MAG: alpha/beta hydrolase [Hyphomicrobiales bacterium]|nr:alpha/beta hydrolase [Hyphomicrobiales bacterium]